MTSICHDIPIGRMNIRQIKDTLNSIRAAWVQYKGWEIHGITDALICLTSQLGLLVSTAMPSNVIVDDESVEPVRGNTSLNSVTNKEQRRCINILMILFRSIHIHKICQPPEEGICENICKIEKHHVLAGEDEFHSMSMHWDMPSAAMLNYTHDFAGMYNNISQV